MSPDFVMGHSVGELTAAHATGVLTLADAALLVAARGRLMQGLAAGGAMVSVSASADAVMPLLRDGVAIAAINAPESVVLSGEHSAVSAIVQQLAERGCRTRQLAVSHAFHSSLMEPILADFERIAAGVDVRKPQIGLVSNVTAELAGSGFRVAAVLGDSHPPAGTVRRQRAASASARRYALCRGGPGRRSDGGHRAVAVARPDRGDPRPGQRTSRSRLATQCGRPALCNRSPGGLGGGVRRLGRTTGGVAHLRVPGAAVLVDARPVGAR